MQLFKRFLYLGHYISMSFGLAAIISSIIAMVATTVYFFQNRFLFNWTLYTETLWFWIKPLVIIVLCALFIIGIISIWYDPLKEPFYKNLQKPMDDFFHKISFKR